MCQDQATFAPTNITCACIASSFTQTASCCFLRGCDAAVAATDASPAVDIKSRIERNTSAQPNQEVKRATTLACVTSGRLSVPVDSMHMSEILTAAAAVDIST